MSGGNFLRFGRCKGAGVVKKAARHNRRAVAAEVAATPAVDPGRSHLNYTLAGPPTADEVAQLADELMKEAGVLPLRKDAVQAVEVLFSLPPETEVDHRAYFHDCLQWTMERFGGAKNVLSADVHLDESAPHLHVLLLPLVDGRMNGSAMIGGQQKMSEHHESFGQAVVCRHGLVRKVKPRASRPRYGSADTAIRQLQRNPMSVAAAELWSILRQQMERHPSLYQGAIDALLAPSTDEKSPRLAAGETRAPEAGPNPANPIGFADRKARSETDREAKPIGVDALPSTQSLCSVGFREAAPSKQPLPVDESSHASGHRGAAPASVEAQPTDAGLPSTRGQRTTPVARSCDECKQLTRARTCGTPEHAGLIPQGEGFGIAWPEFTHAAACPAFEPRRA